ncbi:MAG: hypothetical protein WD042_05140 [Phycisphaeraceae bacterium]
MPKLLGILNDAGWERQWSGLYAANRYQYAIGHRYDAQDFEACELLQTYSAQPTEDLDTGWGQEGKLRIEYRDLRKKAKRRMALGIGSVILVSASMRKMIEDSQLGHARFRPTLLENTQESLEGRVHQLLPWSKAPDGPWWELTSDVVLPPVTERTPLEDKDGKPVKPDFSSGCWEAPVNFEIGHLHYARSALKKLPRFDIALTHEHWSNGHFPADPFGWLQRRIVSQRFYRFAVEHKLKVDFRPVEIDEDL